MSEERLARMEEKIDGLVLDMATVKAMRSQVEEHHERIYGNGQPGLIKDVDRLKQWKKSLYWLVGLLGTATAGDFISSFVGKK